MLCLEDIALRTLPSAHRLVIMVTQDGITSVCLSLLYKSAQISEYRPADMGLHREQSSW